MTIRRTLLQCALPGLLLAGFGFDAGLAAVEPAQGGDAKVASGEPEKPSESQLAAARSGAGEWLVDEEGLEYRLEPLPKEGAHFTLEEDGRLRYNYRVVYEVLDEDDDFFYAKIYRSAASSFPGRVEPTAEQLAEVASTYAAEVPVRDRLRFEPFDRGLPKQGQWRNGFDVADMNGDGHLDILHSPPRKGATQPVIFLGDGKGNWTFWQQVRFPPDVLFDYGDAEAADFNGDGRMDIAVAMHLRGLVAMVGDGEGKFTTWSKGLDFDTPGQGGGGTSFSSRAIKVVDWNGDGKPDLLALGEGPKPGTRSAAGAFSLIMGQSFGPVIYLNQGDGTWVRKTQGNDKTEVFGDHLALGDLNHDGRVDFVTSCNGINRRDIVHLGQEDHSWLTTKVQEIRPRGYLRAVEVADFNGDGRDDLALAYTNIEVAVWRTGIDVLYGREDGGWDRRTLAIDESRLGVFALGSGDLDGDGHTDLVGVTGDGDSWIFLGDGEGFFHREETTEIPAPPGGCRGYSVSLTDLDGDGAAELIANFAGEPSALFAPDRCRSRGALTVWKVAQDSSRQP